MIFEPTITSRSNARVKLLRASLSGEASVPGELVGIEGEHLIMEALRSGLEPQAIFLREGSESILDRAALSPLRSRSIVILGREVFASAVDTAAPQGIAAMFAIPALPAPLRATGPLLVLEAVRDPGNLGTLLRSAEAFGAPFVITTADCAHPWNPKVVRASAGSVFRMPVLPTPLDGLRTLLDSLDRTCYAAVVEPDRAKSALECDLRHNAAILIGNEGSGLSAAALSIADVRVRIRCEVESLNAAVAGSILLYEAMRQHHGVR